MNPAFSVIFFTTASGAGYGLLALLGAGTYFSFLPADKTLMLVATLTALSLITAGLLSSTFHLGHPERAWRAITQWRSSWLSREGVFAILTYLPAMLFLYGWARLDSGNQLTALAGLTGAILALITVFTTAMIYASLRSIHAWCNKWVPLNYLLIALSTGLVLLNAFVAWFGAPSTMLKLAAIVALGLAFAAKIAYWRFIDASSSASTAASAIGVSSGSRVDLTQAPHSETNYLQQEMGFQIARKHAQKLRRMTIATAFAAPAGILAIALLGSGLLSIIGCSLAVVSAALGTLIERWLFFAEAKHTVNLYYGANCA